MVNSEELGRVAADELRPAFSNPALKGRAKVIGRYATLSREDLNKQTTPLIICLKSRAVKNAVKAVIGNENHHEGEKI